MPKKRKNAMKQIALMLLGLLAIPAVLTAQEPLLLRRHPLHSPPNVPRALERRAADILELQRFASEEWREARLSGKVFPIYRPDMEEPAYFEFKVEPQGFLILSSGAHDFPLVMMSYSGERTPSEQMEDLAEGREIGKIFHLDDLSFAAESPDGEYISSLGEIPWRLVRNEPGSVQVPESVETFLVAGAADDETPGEFITEEGPLVELPYDLASWDSWQELKAGYGETYAALLEQKRAAAAYDWETENMVQEYGEGIAVGSTYWVALLSEEMDIAVEGPGAGLAEITRLQRPGLPAAIAITPFAAIEGADLRLHITYADREAELLSFFFVNAGQGKNGWTTIIDHRAGSAADQRIYGQLWSGGCPSGCGATAWAMLLGWADNQAAQGNPAWAHRFGIYRENGGYGYDVAAPRDQDSGVDNMTWEIAGHLGSFCVGGQTATLPTSMWFVSKYLRYRTGATERSHYYFFFDGIDDAIQTMTRTHSPVIIGTGFLAHYPLAWGSQVRRRIVRHCFIWCWDVREYETKMLINNGQRSYSDYDSLYINTNSFFVGQLKAN